NVPICVNAFCPGVAVVGRKETLKVHDAAGRAGPQEGVKIASGCRTISKANLLTAGNAVAERLSKLAGMQVHDAAGCAGPQERVRIVSGCRTTAISNLLTARNALA